MYLSEKFDYGSAVDTFWLCLVMVNGEILELFRRIWLHEFNVLISAIEVFME